MTFQSKPIAPIFVELQYTTKIKQMKGVCLEWCMLNVRDAFLNSFLLYCACSLSACTAPISFLEHPSRGEIEHLTYAFPEAGRDSGYALYVPTGYDGQQPLPLLVVLHGLHSNSYQIIRYPGLVAQAEDKGYLLVAPMGYNKRGWYGMFGQERAGDTPTNLGELSERDVINVIAKVRKRFNVDRQRIFLYGHSMGGGGSFHLLGKYPQQFAAIATVAPAYYSKTRSEHLEHVAAGIFIVQGDKDTLVDVDYTRSLVAALKEDQHEVEYIEVKGGGHLVPAWSYWDEIFEFFSKHKLDIAAPSLEYKSD